MKKIVFIVFIMFTSSWLAAAPAVTDQAPIPVDEAFQLSASATPNAVILHWDIAPGYQLYRERIAVSLAHSAALKLGTFDLPEGTAHDDPALGHYQTYSDALTLTLPILNPQLGEYPLMVLYQGCADGGFCYPPQARLVTLQLSTLGNSVHSIEITTPPYSTKNKVNSIWLTLLTFFGFGLLLSFTPCVLPMLPILSSVIIGQQGSTKHAFGLSLTYVVAMAAAYAAAGMVAGLLGGNLQAWLQQPWILILFAFLFVILATSLFGFFELRLPHKLQHQLTKLTHRQHRGGYIGVALMGALSILIVSPCISAPLVAALLYISSSKQTAFGGILLFVMGLGMGVPLLIIGTLGQRFLPKRGVWMHRVKEVLGVLLLLTAVWLLYRLLPAYVCLILWGLIGMGSAIYWGIARRKNYSRRFVGIVILWILFIGSGTIFVGGVMKHTDPLHPLRATQSTLPFTLIKSSAELNTALADAKGKMILVDFYADWCVSCKIMDNTIFNQTDVQSLLQNIIVLRVDVTQNSVDDQAMEKMFHVFAPPTILLLDANGQEIASARMVGDVSKKEFMATVAKIIS